MLSVNKVENNSNINFGCRNYITRRVQSTYRNIEHITAKDKKPSFIDKIFIKILNDYWVNSHYPRMLKRSIRAEVEAGRRPKDFTELHLVFGSKEAEGFFKSFFSHK